MLSISKREKLESQLKKGALPQLSEEAIFNMFNQAAEKYSQYFEEQIVEVYGFLRPNRNEYATNTQNGFGHKVIL